jgi:hypothetical protein
MQDKGRIIMIGVLILVLIGAIFYIAAPQNLELWDFFTIVLIVLIAIGTIYIIWDRTKNLKAGLPADDERGKVIHWKAGAYTYYATIWIAVGAMWYNIFFADNMGYPELSTEGLVGVIVLLSGVVWFTLNFYLMRKGEN